jgi:tetraprenyl-beta-curcumene synthase
MRAPHGHRVGRPALFAAFAWAALRYWLTVFPRAASELRHWRRSAGRIEDPRLRVLAAAALAKRANMEGAAAFATFVPWRARASVVRALVAFQAIYNYADMLAEQPNEDPVGDARRVHQALLLALDPAGAGCGTGGGWSVGDSSSASGGDAVRTAGSADGDFLAEMISVCETASWQLPSYGTVAGAAIRAAGRIVAFQSLSLGPRGELESWAQEQCPGSARYAWWELAAAAGSSLAVHALIAAAASPELSAEEVTAIAAAYFPCIGALHSLLDSLLDVQEDSATGQLRLLDCYPSREQAAAGLRRLATDALKLADELPNGAQHSLLVTSMACSYLAAPEARASGVERVGRQVRAALGPLARPMLVVFALRRLAGRPAPPAAPLAAPAGGAGSLALPADAPQATLSVGVDPQARGADARAA